MSHLQVSGRLAYKAGITKDACPLAKGSMARREWMRGWNAASREANKEEADK